MESRKALERLVLESKASKLQKELVKYIDPDHILELERELKEILRVERALLKLAQRMNISPQRLQMVVEDFLDLINLMQL